MYSIFIIPLIDAVSRGHYARPQKYRHVRNARRLHTSLYDLSKRLSSFSCYRGRSQRIPNSNIARISLEKILMLPFSSKYALVRSISLGTHHQTLEELKVCHGHWWWCSKYRCFTCSHGIHTPGTYWKDLLLGSWLFAQALTELLTI